MTEGEVAPRVLAPAAKLLLLVVGVLIGLFGSFFGPFYLLIVGVVVVIIGIVQVARHANAGRSIVMFGAGVMLGAVAYITIGVLTPDGPATQTGCVNSAGEPCDPGE